MKKTIYVCDICGKEISKFIEVEILFGDKRKWRYDDLSLRHQNKLELLICDNCVGSKIYRCDEYENKNNIFRIKDEGKNLLKMLKIIK